MEYIVCSRSHDQWIMNITVQTCTSCHILFFHWRVEAKPTLKISITRNYLKINKKKSYKHFHNRSIFPLLNKSILTHPAKCGKKGNRNCKITCSEARPPRVMQVISKSCSLVNNRFSLGTYWANPSAAVPRGTIVTLSKGSACSKNQPATAWPDSW